MSADQNKTVRTQTFQLTQIKGPNGKFVEATIHPKPSGCVLYFYKDGKSLENEYKDKKKNFSVFIKKNARDVLKMLSSRKGKIVPHRKNPKQLLLSWERVMVPTNFTLDGKLLKATFTTSVKEDEEGKYWQTIFRFYTEDGNPVKHTIKGEEKMFTHCFRTDCEEDITDEANREWLLQEGQVVPHPKFEGSLRIRLGKAPEKTSITIEIDGKQIPVFTKYRVCKDPDNPRIFVVKYVFYVNQRRIMHYNSSKKHVHFTYYQRTNNPQHVTDDAIKNWYSNSRKKIVPHKDRGGRLWFK